MASVHLKTLRNLQVTITTGHGHTLTSDEPREDGGDGAGPTPRELLLASLGS